MKQLMNSLLLLHLFVPHFLLSSTAANSQTPIYVDSLKVVGKYEGYKDFIAHVSSKIELELKPNHEYVMVDKIYINNSRPIKSKKKGTWMLNADSLILMPSDSPKNNIQPELLKYQIMNGDLWHSSSYTDTNNLFVKDTKKKLLTMNSIFSANHFVIETYGNYRRYHYIFDVSDSALLVTCLVSEKDTLFNHSELKLGVRDSLCLYLKNICSLEIIYNYRLRSKYKIGDWFNFLSISSKKDVVNFSDGTLETSLEIQRMIKNNLKWQ